MNWITKIILENSKVLTYDNIWKVGSGRPKVKPLENTSLEGSMKEETQGALALG